MNCVSQNAPTNPMAIPITASDIPCRTTIRKTSAGCAPNAMRMPISCVREADRLTHHAEDSNHREYQSHESKQSQQKQIEAVLFDRSGDHFLHGLDLGDGQVFIYRPNLILNRADERQWSPLLRTTSVSARGKGA